VSGAGGTEDRAAPAGGQPRAGAAAGPFHGVRIYVQSQPRRAYLAQVIAPVTRDLAASVGASRIRITPGWRFGAHFDVRADDPAAGTIDWDGVARVLADGAHGRPAPALPGSDEEYLRAATLLGQMEAVPPPYLPRHPHGHTELLPAATGPLADLKATGGAHLLAPLTEAAGLESEGAVLARVAEAFLALAATHPHGVRFGTFSLRSHAEAFFHWAGPQADYRSSFEQRMRKDRVVLEALVGRVGDGSPSDAAAVWSHAFHGCMAEFEGRITDADIDGAIAAGSAGPASGPARRTSGRSDFHTAVDASGVIDAPPAWFAGYRLTINLFYQLLPALDVSPVRRFYLCHAVASTVDAVFGETWQSRLAAVQTMMAGAGAGGGVS
jgi:hypothetical protein